MFLRLFPRCWTYSSHEKKLVSQVLAVIPARGGSKRIPGKNIRQFCGKPILAYSIEAARAAGVFDRVICSTDSDSIAEVAVECGAEVPFRRPRELSDDFTGTDAVVLHALETLAEQGWNADLVCCIYATAPLLSADDLRRGYELLQTTDAGSAFSVTTFAFNIFRALRVNARERIEMFWPENRMKRSQDLPEAYHDAGQFYWAHVPRYLRERTFYGVDAAPVFLPRWRVQDIDTMEDWTRAEHLYRSIMQSDPSLGTGAG